MKEGMEGLQLVQFSKSSIIKNIYKNVNNTLLTHS